MKNFYSVKEIAEQLDISYQHAYRLVDYCRNCQKDFKRCKCEKFNPVVKGINLSIGAERTFWRIPKKEIDELITEKIQRHKPTRVSTIPNNDNISDKNQKMPIKDLYNLQETTKLLGFAYITVYKRVAYCKTCKQIVTKCNCLEFNPLIKAINVGYGERITWRIPRSEIERILGKSIGN